MMKGRRFTSRDKTLVMAEFLETDIRMADPCRRYNVHPPTFSKWKARFMEGGRNATEPREVSVVARHRHETDKPRQIIAEQATVIE